MKQTLFAFFGAALLAACNTTITPSSRALGVLEIGINSSGVSTARLETGLQTQAFTYRELNLQVGTGTTQVVTVADSVYDYLVATFPISHATSSNTAFQNLTLYALARSGAVGDTAISSIQNFGGVTDSAAQARLAKFLVPVQAVKVSSGAIVIDDEKADFQAFDSTTMTAITAAAGTAINATTDTILNYGFTARCVTNCTANSRRIPTNGTGSISIAIRVPKAATATTYKFRMNFVVLDDDVRRVTRSEFPPETVTQAETRGATVGATRLMQFGLNRFAPTLARDTVDTVYTSKLNENVHALGLGRISAGNNHTCGLTATGKAYCWGDGTSGKLGSGGGGSYLPVEVAATADGISHLFSSISVGYDTTCGITTGGAALCWGAGTLGRLGNGGTSDSSIPVAVVAPTGGNVLTFSQLHVGSSHACGLTDQGEAYCWGYGYRGKLGNNADANSSVPVPVSGGFFWQSIGAGSKHSCGITTGGVAYCWGDGLSGELGIGGSTIRNYPLEVAGSLTWKSVSVGTGHSCGITTSGAGYCWGNGGNSQLGYGSTTSASSPVAVVAPSGGSVLTFSSLSAGGSRSCGTTPSGAAYCWGYGTNGPIGQSASNSSIPVLVGGGLIFAQVVAGDSHTCGITSSGTAHCWGRGSDGRLGNNSFVNSQTPVQIHSSFGL
jgi:alpha-tubulin suppressor-like RCC1 family protein